jgi:hypothetical protein
VTNYDPDKEFTISWKNMNKVEWKFDPFEDIGMIVGYMCERDIERNIPACVNHNVDQLKGQ